MHDQARRRSHSYVGTFCYYSRVRSLSDLLHRYSRYAKSCRSARYKSFDHVRSLSSISINRDSVLNICDQRYISTPLGQHPPKPHSRMRILPVRTRLPAYANAPPATQKRVSCASHARPRVALLSATMDTYGRFGQDWRGCRSMGWRRA